MLPGHEYAHSAASAAGVAPSTLCRAVAVRLLAVEPPREVGDQRGEIRDAFAQRRHPDRHDRQSFIEIGAERAGRAQRHQIAVGGGEDPEVDHLRLVFADAADDAVLEDAQQLDLERQRRVVDLVQEHRPARGPRELTFVRAHRTGERPLGVAEQLRFDEIVGDRGAVDRNEAARPSRRPFVQQARRDLLARPGLAGQQHRHRRTRRLRHLAQHRARGVAGGDEPVGRRERAARPTRAPRSVAPAAPRRPDRARR